MLSPLISHHVRSPWCTTGYHNWKWEYQEARMKKRSSYHQNNLMSSKKAILRMTGLLESKTINERVFIRALLPEPQTFWYLKTLLYFPLFYCILITIYSPYTFFHLHPTHLNHHTVVGALFLLSFSFFFFCSAPFIHNPPPTRAVCLVSIKTLLKRNFHLKSLGRKSITIMIWDLPFKATTK